MFVIKSDLRFSIRVDLQLQLQLEVRILKLKLKLNIDSDKIYETGFRNFDEFHIEILVLLSLLRTIK